MHMSDQFWLLTDFDAYVLCNTVKPYKGDSEPLLLCRLWQEGWCDFDALAEEGFRAYV